MTIENQIDTLWGILPHPKDSVIRWMAKRNGKVRGDYVESSRELQFAADTFKDWDFYVTPNPCRRSTGVRPSTADVMNWSWLFIDVDPVEPVYNPYIPALRALILLEGWLCNGEISATEIYSGRGVQYWIRLDDAEPSRESCIAMRYLLHKLDKEMGIAYGCRIDTTVSDLPRAMRCPGTRNSKTGRECIFLQVGKTNAGLVQAIRRAVPEYEYEAYQDPTVLWNGNINDFLAGTTWKARSFLTMGWQEPGRHEAMWHAAKKLHEAGTPYNDCLASVKWGNDMCRNGQGQISPLPDKDIKIVIDRLYRK